MIVEVVVGPRSQFDWGRISDVFMLAITDGRERTVGEYETLLSTASFTLARTIGTESVMTIVDARRCQKTSEQVPRIYRASRGSL